jgi:hypothetical protein
MPIWGVSVSIVPVWGIAMVSVTIIMRVVPSIIGWVPPAAATEGKSKETRL